MIGLIKISYHQIGGILNQKRLNLLLTGTVRWINIKLSLLQGKYNMLHQLWIEIPKTDANLQTGHYG